MSLTLSCIGASNVAPTIGKARDSPPASTPITSVFSLSRLSSWGSVFWNVRRSPPLPTVA